MRAARSHSAQGCCQLALQPRCMDFCTSGYPSAIKGMLLIGSGSGCEHCAPESCWLGLTQAALQGLQSCKSAPPPVCSSLESAGASVTILSKGLSLMLSGSCRGQVASPAAFPVGQLHPPSEALCCLVKPLQRDFSQMPSRLSWQGSLQCSTTCL